MRRPAPDDAAVSGRIDWAELHRRLARMAQMLAQPAVDAGTRARVLRERARAAAHARPQGQAAARPLQAVEFLLSYERYALDIACVHEVLALRHLTPLPGAPAFVAGLVNARGRIVTVLDPKVFFELPSKGLPDRNRVIVLADHAMECGLLVDAVTGVTDIALDRLQPPLATFAGVRRDYLRGLRPDGLALLDGTRILADSRIVVRQPAP